MDNEDDVVVIGAGLVGENAAGTRWMPDFHRAGRDGPARRECSVLGACRRRLLAPPQAVADARWLPGVSASFDPAAVLERRTSFTSVDDSAQVEWAEGRRGDRPARARALRTGGAGPCSSPGTATNAPP
ncbi:hypothetical protein HBB16_21100 [Pseudonocardia sp. MCCB 268]|nr:hypothetical protein [Pseudonocardia cytotoxica]